MSEMPGAEVAASLSYHDAQQLTERIKLKVGTIQDNIDALAALVTRAKRGQADVVLGYKSWTAYIVECVGSDPLDLTRAERKKLVGFLANEGMPLRAIAPVVGVHHDTVLEDIKSTVGLSDSRPATVTSLDGRERPSHQRPPLATSSRPHINPTTGEVRPPVSTSEPRRRPLGDGFRDATLDLAKLITRVENLVADDRYPKNRDEVARYANDLIRARDALQRVIDQMS